MNLNAFSLEGKIAWVTGASYGIGFAIAEAYAQCGAKVVFNDINQELVDKGIAAYKEKGLDVKGYVCDVTDESAVNDLVKKIEAEVGEIDILVNNAGISYIGLLTDMSPDDWNRIVTTNLTSVFNCCNLAIPDMVKKQSGKIINISSVWGDCGASCEVAYSATKGGINSFTKALAKELAPSNIQVNAIACGAIDTEMNSFLTDEELIELTNDIPAGRLGQAEEVAEFVYQVCKNNTYLTGQVIKLDGGWV